MQNTWLSFKSLDGALQGTRGNTQSTVILVRDNLFVGETVEWVATGAVNDFGEWSDASVVLTDQRLFVAYTNLILEQTYGNMIPRVPVPGIARLQGGGDKAHFKIEAVTDSTIALNPDHLAQLQKLLGETDVLNIQGPPTPPPAEDPKSALLTAKELLDAGLITEAEYEAKKQEILGRL